MIDSATTRAIDTMLGTVDICEPANAIQEILAAPPSRLELWATHVPLAQQTSIVYLVITMINETATRSSGDASLPTIASPSLPFIFSLACMPVVGESASDFAQRAAALAVAGKDILGPDRARLDESQDELPSKCPKRLKVTASTTPPQLEATPQETTPLAPPAADKVTTQLAQLMAVADKSTDPASNAYTAKAVFTLLVDMSVQLADAQSKLRLHEQEEELRKEVS